MARYFDGITDRIDYNSPNDISAGPWTIAFDVHAVAYVGTANYFFNWRNSGGTIGLIVGRSGTGTKRVHTNIYTSGNPLVRESIDNTLVLSTHQRIMATWDGVLDPATGLKIYVNGTEVSYATSIAGSGTPHAADDEWSFGGRILDDNRNFNGRMCIVGVWNRVLTAGERAAYNKGYSPECMPKSLIFAPDLIRHQRDPISGQVGTLDGTSVSSIQPNIIFRSRPQLTIPLVGEVKELAGTVVISSTVIGELTKTGVKALTGTVAIACTTAGILKVAKELAGTSAISSTVSGGLTVLSKREWYILYDDSSDYVYGDLWKAQTFTVGTVGVNEDFKIVLVKIKGFKAGLPAAVLNFAVKAVDESTPPKPTGADLAVGSCDPRDWSTDPEWHAVNMSSFILRDSTQYALVLKSPDSTGDTNCPYWRCNYEIPEPPYTGGRKWYTQNGGVDWYWVLTVDYMFEIWGETVGVKTLAGTIAIESETEGALKVTKELSGVVEAKTVVTGEIVKSGGKQLAGVIDIQMTVVGDLISTAELAGVVEIQSVVIGNLSRPKYIATESIAIQCTTDAALKLTCKLATEILVIQSALTGAISLTRELASETVEIHSAVTGAVLSLGVKLFVGTIEIHTVVTGDMVMPTGERLLAGEVEIKSIVVGELIGVHGGSLLPLPPFMQKDLIDPYASGAWLWLLEIVVPGQTTQRLARNTENVHYDGEDFDKFNIQIGKQIFSSDGSIPRVILRTFQDISRKIENIINETKGALGGAVKLIRVNEKFLTSTVEALEADYDLLASESDSEWCTFTLGIPNPLTQRFPLRDYSSSMCWKTPPPLFKGPECQYTGEDTTCTGTYEDCYGKGNAVHWGGELGLSPSVVKERVR